MLSLECFPLYVLPAKMQKRVGLGWLAGLAGLGWAAVFCILYSVSCMQYTVFSILYAVFCIQYAVYSISTTLHCTALHYSTAHYTTLHYTTLDYTTLHLSLQSNAFIVFNAFS